MVGVFYSRQLIRDGIHIGRARPRCGSTESTSQGRIDIVKLTMPPLPAYSGELTVTL